MDRNLACRFPQYKHLDLDAEHNQYVYAKVADEKAHSELDEVLKENSGSRIIIGDIK